MGLTIEGWTVVAGPFPVDSAAATDHRQRHDVWQGLTQVAPALSAYVWPAGTDPELHVRVMTIGAERYLCVRSPNNCRDLA